MEGLIKITPDKEKAGSIFRMVEVSLEMVKTIDENKFPSNTTKEYYDILRELISIILLLDGYKTYGDGAHKKMIEYLEKNYREFESHEIALIDELRMMRNKISYDGFFVKADYIRRKEEVIEKIIRKLKGVVLGKLD